MKADTGAALRDGRGLRPERYTFHLDSTLRRIPEAPFVPLPVLLLVLAELSMVPRPDSVFASSREGDAARAPDVQDCARAPRELMSRADLAWDRREGSPGSEQPDRSQVDAAVAAYEQAVERCPEDPGIRARWVRALVFRGEYLETAEEVQRETFDTARQGAREGFELLGRGHGGSEALDGLDPKERATKVRALAQGTGWSDTDLAALHFWDAVAWGRWADRVGRLKAARQGVAAQLRLLAGTALELDETYADAGPHRFLGRLHAQAPKIPFITGWVDRDQAVAHLERALELAPQEPENALFLAEALLEYRPERSREARDLLRELAERKPRPDHRVEDMQTLERARERLRAGSR